MTPRVVKLLAVLAFVTPHSLTAQPARLAGVDIYRSAALDSEGLNRRYASLLDSARAAVASGDMDRVAAALSSLGRRIWQDHSFAFLDLSPIQYFEADTVMWYLTVDVVDSIDVDRLSFAPRPSGQVEGLDSVLSRWRTFEEEGWRRRAFWAPGQPCPALHCLFSFEDPDLAPVAVELGGDALGAAASLERMLREDSDEEDRATAAFVFAHHPDTGRVVRALVDRLSDPSSLVRNNAARVLAFLAQHRPSVEIPLDRVIPLVDGPTVTDRNKALAILNGMAQDPERHGDIRAGVGHTLLRLLRLKQPNNRDFAHSILKRISGLDLGDDVAAWSRWLATHARTGVASPPLRGSGSTTLPGVSSQIGPVGSDSRATWPFRW